MKHFKYEVKFAFETMSLTLMCETKSEIDREVASFGTANLVSIKENL